MFPQQLAELLIKAIKLRPALYNKLDPQYHSHKKFKYDLWREVCAEVDPSWSQMTPQHKMEYQRHLQRRWKSLRDCFTRELTTQKQERLQHDATGEPIKHRKKYEHFKQMLFLLDGSDETFIPDTDNESVSEDYYNIQKSENLKQEMDSDESETSCTIKKQLFPHQLSGYLIKAIKERPELYKKTSNCNKSHKHKLWKEVCKEVNPNWAQMPQKRKSEYLSHLKRRWKSLRDCFARELAKQKRDVQEQATNAGLVKERKKYEHFDEMLFLLENCDESEQPEDSDEEIADDNSDGDPLEHPETETVDFKQEIKSDSDDNSDEKVVEFVVKNLERKPKALKKHKKTIRKSSVDDEDRQFLISLVPSFRRLNAKQRLEAKIRFLNVLKDVRFRDGKKSKIVKRR